MSHSRKKHHHKRHHKPHSDDKGKANAKPHTHHKKTRVEEIKELDDRTKQDTPAFFHGVRNETAGATQTTNLNININQADDKEKDCLTGCLSSVSKCFK